MSCRKNNLDLPKMVKKLTDGLNSPNRTVHLPERDLHALCQKAQNVFAKEPMLLEVPVPVNIVGDIHGQFADLLRIFSTVGFPPKQQFLFLGDYVDRGRQGIETIALLFACKILYPKKFFLLRGNHECSAITLIYGFHSECLRRYNSKSLWRSFMDAFNFMPISALVADRIICMHGGISPDLTDLQQIRDIPRPLEIPDTGLMCDILWSDPNSEIIGGWAENARGISFTFASDVVSEFCRNLNIELICRAHQVVEDGYEFFANRKLLTVFSAPNYCSEFDNAAAVLCVSKDLECSFVILRPQKPR